MKYLLFSTVFCTFLASTAFATTHDAQKTEDETKQVVENQEEDTDYISAHRKVTDRTKHGSYRNKLARPDSIEKKYADFKDTLEKEAGLTYSLDISELMQRTAPHGNKTAWQTIYSGNANWDMFKSDKIGAGSMQFGYTAVRYWGTNANTLMGNTGVITPINDFPAYQNSFNTLTYTHQLPGDMDWLALTVGQFPMYNWDGSAYDANQQVNFLNYSFAQNASSSYPVASLGGFATITPHKDLNFVIGMQDAHNVTGTSISTKKFGKGDYASFASVNYTPTVMGLPSQYSLMVYNQPSVSEQPGTSNGWSLNALQFITKKWALFTRVNGASNSPEAIKQSYALGAVYNNPLNRNALDQIGFAGSVNKLNKAVNGANTRSIENVLEAYWAWGVSNFMTITPDIQFYINPGANTKSNTATVTSLRATLMF